MDDRDDGLTDNQKASIIITQKVMSFASIVGSIYIIQDVLRVLRNPEKRKDFSVGQIIYHRIMLGVAGSDFILALTLFLGTWPMSKDTEKYAVGSKALCETVGFFLGWVWLLSPFYNCSLASYYLFSLKFGWKGEKMKASEKWLHILPLVLSIIPVLIALCLRQMGPSGYACR